MKTGFILFTFFTLFSMGIIDNSRGPVYPEILTIFSISKSTGSYIFSGASLFAFIITIFSRLWLNKLGAVNSQRLSLLLYTISCIMMGLAPGDSIGFSIFLLASLTLGIGVGINSITFNLIINHATEENQRRKVFAGLHAMYGIASLLAPFILSLFYLGGLNWQNFFLCLSTLPFIVFIFSFKLESKVLKSKLIEVVTIPKKEIYLASIILGAYIAGEVILSSRLVVYLHESYDWQMDMASGQLSLFFVCLTGGRLFFAIKNIHYDSYKLLIISLLGSLACLVLGILVYPVLLCVSALFMSFFFPCAMDLFTRKYQEEVEGFMAKVMMYAGGLLVLFHWLFGKLATEVGVDIAIWISPLMMLISLYLLQFQGKFLSRSS